MSPDLEIPSTREAPPDLDPGTLERVREAVLRRYGNWWTCWRRAAPDGGASRTSGPAPGMADL